MFWKNPPKEQLFGKDLASAFEFYSKLGYIEVPSYHRIPKKAHKRTWDIDACARYDQYKDDDLVWVGSAEQSLLYTMNSNSPKKGMSLSLCCRPDDAFRDSSLYEEYFLKLELYHLNPEGWKEMTADALKFMYYHYKADPEVVPTVDGYDLELNGIEIGSFGKRSTESVSYGTGLAPFRVHAALQMRKK